jgi:hypothetical protein
VALLSTTFLIGSPPDDEEFRFSILSAWLHADALRHGRVEFWTPILGLGVPLPLTPNFLLHPLLPLLATTSPATWARVLLLAHTLLGAGGMWLLLRRVGATRPTRALGVATFLLATPTQNYILIDFWPSHYVVWTSAPWLLLLAWDLLEADTPAGLRTRSILLGLCTGLVIASGNPGHLLVYVVLAGMVGVVYREQVARRLPWIALSVLIAGAIASPNVAQLVHELPLLDPALQVWTLPDPLPWWAAWNAFVAPVGVTDPRLPFTRTLFFGGPFAVLCVVGCVRFARRLPELVLTVVACTVLLFTELFETSWLSARFHFRDPLIVAAIPLAGLAFDQIFASRTRRLGAAFVAAAQLLVLGAAAWPALARPLTPDARRAHWFAGGTADTAAVDLLLQLAQPAGRMVFSPAADEEIHDAQRLEQGLGVNALAYRGFPVVNGWFKGTSTATVWPDERRLYGRIRVPQPAIESATTLDALGIRYVLANPDEMVAADLRPRGAIPKRAERFVLYENRDAWPEAFVLDAAAEELALPPLPNCNQRGLLCTDWTQLAERRSTDPLVIRSQGGRARVRLFPGNEPRLLIVSQMFRRDWVASAGTDRLTTIRVFGGLLGIRVPPGIDSVDLHYRPLSVMAATALAWGTLAVGIGALVVLRFTGNRTKVPRHVSRAG